MAGSIGTGIQGSQGAAQTTSTAARSGRSKRFTTIGIGAGLALLVLLLIWGFSGSGDSSAGSTGDWKTAVVMLVLGACVTHATLRGHGNGTSWITGGLALLCLIYIAPFFLSNLFPGLKDGVQFNGETSSGTGSAPPAVALPQVVEETIKVQRQGEKSVRLQRRCYVTNRLADGVTFEWDGDKTLLFRNVSNTDEHVRVYHYKPDDATMDCGVESTHAMLAAGKL